MISALSVVVEAVTLIFAAVVLIRLRSVVLYTTLTTVWPWAWVAWAAAAVGWGLRVAGSTALVSYVDYFSAVAVLSPPLASLGARRPTCRSWPFFVLLPMFAVLCWPAISVGLATKFSRPLELETPAIAMYLVVLIMAWGNYAFGRFKGYVILLAICLAIQVSGWVPKVQFFTVDQFRLYTIGIATLLCFSLRGVADVSFLPEGSPPMRSLRLYWPRASAPTVAPSFNDLDEFDLTLHEFGELYGLVWWLRMQDRLNVFAAQHKWPGRFEGRRGIWTEPLSESQEAEVDRAFRWLFRRFVDAPWLDDRLPSPEIPSKDTFTSPVDT